MVAVVHTTSKSTSLDTGRRLDLHSTAEVLNLELMLKISHISVFDCCFWETQAMLTSRSCSSIRKRAHFG